MGSLSWLLRLPAALAALAASFAAGADAQRETGERPNVLFISVDDLNEWIGPLHDGTRGKPRIETPNLDRLAAEGVVFTNAHCSVPLCTPSRASVLSGRNPRISTGEVAEYDRRQQSFAVRSLPQHFADRGYTTRGAGKILPPVDEAAHWDEYVVIDRLERANPPLNGLPGKTRGTDPLDWGVVAIDEAELPDARIAAWAASVLAAETEGPFFLGVGFHLPHLPWYLPRETFELHAPDPVTLPDVAPDDLDDVPIIGRVLAWSSLSNLLFRPTARDPFARFRDLAPGQVPDARNSDHARILRGEQWEEAVAAYSAASAFVDACVGVVLDALAAGPHADDTIVVVWSDHGWHLGSKEHWRKRTLWEESTRSPLFFRGPGIGAGRALADPASLVDLYPTLVDLAGIEAPEHALDGRSLAPALAGEEQEEAAALTFYLPGNATARTRRWRYIRYEDGAEELYDHAADPMERVNLVARPETFEGPRSELDSALERVRATLPPAARSR